MDKRILAIILLIIIIVVAFIVLEWFGILDVIPGVGHDSGENFMPIDFWRK